MSKETDYGILLLTHLAETRETPVFSARELSNETRVPQPMVSKILKTLARQGMLVSQRGPKGGYTLARQPQEITIGQVITAIEGPIALTECIDHPGDCLQEPSCRVRRNWEAINHRVLGALNSINLADMTTPLGEQLVTLDPGEARLA